MKTLKQFKDEQMQDPGFAEGMDMALKIEFVPKQKV
jgi:hypothetical protein